MRRTILFLLTLIVSVCGSDAQNCANTSVGFPPINDLGTGFWRGFQGGLYPDGQNTRPFDHNLSGLTIASQIQPLDVNGVVDSVSGSIVLLSVGMSNTSQEFREFRDWVDTLQNKNQYLVLTNGAQGGESIFEIIDSTTNYWNVINGRLADQGLTNEQVQVIWFKQAEGAPRDTTFPHYPDTLKQGFKIAMNIIQNKFPNVKLCYLSSRIYAGYANTSLNPEPYAYYSGWSVKHLIEDQINGDTTLTFSGPNPKSPWLSWAAYLWADGLTPRSDSLTWICPDDYKADGTHPSITDGRRKVAGLLLDFFSTDETARLWFTNEAAHPIQLISFTATIVSQNEVRLDWSTLTEINNYGFEVQKSVATPNNYQMIQNSFVAGHGTSNVPQYYSFTDSAASLGTWYYRLKQIDLDGTIHYTDGIQVDVLTGVKEESVPKGFALYQNYPNPFNPTTEIGFRVPDHGLVSLKVYDVLGREMATLVDEVKEPGEYTVQWDASGFASGLYFYRLSASQSSPGVGGQAGSFVDTKKLLLLK